MLAATSSCTAFNHTPSVSCLLFSPTTELLIIRACRSASHMHSLKPAWRPSDTTDPASHAHSGMPVGFKKPKEHYIYFQRKRPGASCNQHLRTAHTRTCAQGFKLQTLAHMGLMTGGVHPFGTAHDVRRKTGSPGKPPRIHTKEVCMEPAIVPCCRSSRTHSIAWSHTAIVKRPTCLSIPNDHKCCGSMPSHVTSDVSK